MDQKEYMQEYYQEHKFTIDKQSRSWKKENRESYKKWRHKWYLKNKHLWENWVKKKLKEDPNYYKRRHLRLKLKAFAIVMAQGLDREGIDCLDGIIEGVKPKCIYCGCNDLRGLELNHKEIRGKEKERRSKGNNLYRDIVNGKVDPQTLEVTCGPCNRVHYYHKKYGLNWRVEYLGELEW